MSRFVLTLTLPSSETESGATVPEFPSKVGVISARVLLDQKAKSDSSEVYNRADLWLMFG